MKLGVIWSTTPGKIVSTSFASILQSSESESSSTPGMLSGQSSIVPYPSSW